MSILDREAVAAIDSSDLLSDILAIPDHIDDALWRAQSAQLEPEDARRLVVCGMGGSAIGADLASALIGRDARGPILTNRGYQLPTWVSEGDAVVLSSYSGNTEETLACLEQAQRSGARLYAVSSGGALSEAAHAAGIPVIGLPGIFQPRAAVAYGVVAVAAIAIATGMAPTSLREDLAAAGELLRELAAAWAPDGSDPRAKELARKAFGRLPLIHGADLTLAVAYRWKCQINENAKYPAFAAELPEAGHNEICGWESTGELTAAVAWFLADSDQHPRIADRIAVSSQIAARSRIESETIAVDRATRAERLFSLVLLGDLVSLYLAVLRGVDPTPVAPIDELKRGLADPDTVN